MESIPKKVGSFDVETFLADRDIKLNTKDDKGRLSETKAVYTGFEKLPNHEGAVNLVIATCHAYVGDSYMFDTFGNFAHPQRRKSQSALRDELNKKREGLGEEFWKYRIQNKLRGNRITAPYVALLHFVDKIDYIEPPIHTEQSERLRAVVKELPVILKDIDSGIYHVHPEEFKWMESLIPDKLAFRLKEGESLTLGSLYPVMSLEQKMKVVEKVTSVAERVLKLLTQPVNNDEKEAVKKDI